MQHNDYLKSFDSSKCLVTLTAYNEENIYLINTNNLGFFYLNDSVYLRFTDSNFKYKVVEFFERASLQMPICNDVYTILKTQLETETSYYQIESLDAFREILHISELFVQKKKERELKSKSVKKLK